MHRRARRSAQPLDGMSKFYLEPKDRRGKTIRKGHMVRVVGMPDLTGIRDRPGRLKAEAAFRHTQGRCYKVQGFSRYGFVDLFFKIRAGRNAGWNGIAIEPEFLLVQKRPGRKS